MNQKKRLKGESYIGFSKSPHGDVKHETPKAARKLQPRCQHAVAKKLNDKTYQCINISDDTREKHLKQFWDLPTWCAKKAYVRGLVDTRKPTRRRKGIESSCKQESHDCFLPNNDGIKVRVCQQFFLTTLCVGRDSFKRWVKDDQLTTESKSVPDEEEGESTHSDAHISQGTKQKDKHTVRRQHVAEWLDALPKVPSHYCRSSSKRVYVEATFRSKSHMYRIFESWCVENSYQAVSRHLFADILEERKISIHSPRKDQCDTCWGYKTGQIDEDEYTEHRAKQQEAREAKKKAKAKADDNTLVVTMDLQSVLLAPNMPASAIYYKQKLQVHNFTFYSLNDGAVTLYVWHEGNGGVTSNEFVSCIIDYIKAHDCQHVILISDGCGYQNRNKSLSSALSDLAKVKQVVIEQLILEKGHTMMEADSVHSTLEKIFVPPIYGPTDYVAQMKLARPKQPYSIKVLDYTFFRNYDSLDSNFKSIRPGHKVGQSVVTDIRALLYQPTGEVQYKLRHTEEYNDLPQQRTCRAPRDSPSELVPPSLYQQPLKIKKDKFNHLQQLKTLTPSEYHPFYDALPHD